MRFYNRNFKKVGALAALDGKKRAKMDILQPSAVTLMFEARQCAMIIEPGSCITRNCYKWDLVKQTTGKGTGKTRLEE